MTAFIVTGWVTFLVAAVAGWYRLQEDVDEFCGRRERKESQNENIQRLSNGVVDSGASGSDSDDEQPRLKVAAAELLETLCDLQLVTGTAILIAGLAQGDNLSFYHEAIISSYWNLTLSSFWAAQQGNNKYKEIKDLPSFVRTSAIWCTLILSIFFQSRQTLHDYFKHGYWNALDGDRCFRLNHDHSGEGNGWLWIVGLSLYAFVLSARLLRHIIILFRRITKKRTISADGNTAFEMNHNQGGEGNSWLWIIGLSVYGYIMLLLLSKCLFARFLRIVRKETRRDTNLPFESSQPRIRWNNIASFDFIGGDLDDFRECLQTNGASDSWLNGLLEWIPRILYFHVLDEWLLGKFEEVRKRQLYRILLWAPTVFSFSLTNFLAVWSYGSASFGMDTLAILGYLSWNTLDIIDAKVSNHALVDGEMSWGFGQVLPMVLLGAISFSALDVYQKGKERRNKVKPKVKGPGHLLRSAWQCGTCCL